MCDKTDFSKIQQTEPLFTKTSYSNRNANHTLGYADTRIMSKKGKVYINLCKVPEKSIRYVSDLWNTLVNMSWRWLLVVMALINITVYLIFGLLFLLDAWVSGDFEDPMNNVTCLRGMNNFTSYFMLGTETVTTAGNGYFHPTEFCYLIFIILTGSTIMTIFIDGAFMSVVYAKFGQPAFKWTIFSKRAVINLRNGKLCLIIRINDTLRKHWIDNQVNMFLIKSSISSENEVLPNYISEMEVKPYGMIFWSTEVVHEITSISPLWNVSANDLMTIKFEIVAVIHGSSIQTGQLTRSQTSYLAKEIMWGYKFCSCMEYNLQKREYIINRKAFDAVTPVDTPLCSASTLRKLQIEIELNHRRTSFDEFNPLESETNIT